MILISREKNRTEEQRRWAERKFRLAADAADHLLIEVGEVDLADIPQMEPIRRRLLEKAYENYGKFLGQKGDSPVVRWGSGQACSRLGDILEMLGDLDRAESMHRQAMTLLEPLTIANPDVAEYRRDLARSHLGLGSVLKRINRFREAESSFREAVRLFESLSVAAASSPQDRQYFVDSRYQVGALLTRSGARSKEAEATYLEVVGDQRALAARFRDRPEYGAKLGRILSNLGMFLSAMGRPEEAEEVFEEAIELQTRLVHDSPTLPGPCWQLARSGNNLGSLLMRDRPETARVSFLRSKEIFETLRAEFPKVTQYREELAKVNHNLGLLQKSDGDLARAETSFGCALEILTGLAAEFPAVPEYRQKQAIESFQFHLLRALKGAADATQAVGEALRTHEQLVSKFPDLPEYLDVLGRERITSWRAGDFERKDPSEASRWLEKAVRNHRAAVNINPKSSTYRRHLFDDRGVGANVLLALGQNALAAEAAEELPRILADDRRSYTVAAALLIRCANRPPQGAPPADMHQNLPPIDLSRAVRVLGTAVERGLISAHSNWTFRDSCRSGSARTSSN